jgi:dolichyl-phosphate-mannose--protein O-mannosyl transferase
MDGIFPKTGLDNSTRSQAKRILLRLAVFFFVLCTSHGLLMWLRPLGAHNWFWNMVLGAIVFGVAIRLLRPWFKSGYLLK